MMKWIYAISVAAIVVSAVGMITARTLFKEIVRIAGALVIIYTVLAPMNSLAQSRFSAAFEAARNKVEDKIENSQKSSKKLQLDIISGQICEYIESKAKDYGIICTVKASAFSDGDGNYVIEDITVSYHDKPSDGDKEFMTRLIKDECGIPADKQKHKGR